MLNILIVDDQPKFKVEPALNYLKACGKLEFECEYTSDVNSANRYIKSNVDKIDLIILDLGLPLISDDHLDSLNGLYVIQFLMSRKIQIPVIINSTTSIPNEDKVIERCKNMGINISHVTALDGQWLDKFIQSNLKINII